MSFFTDNPALFAVHQQTYAPGTLPDGTEPLIFSDFKNGVYTLDGAPVTVDDLWEEDQDNWLVFDPATHIVADVGLTTAGGQAGPVLKSGPATTLIGGFTAVITADMVGASPSVVYVELVDIPDFNNEMQFKLSRSGALVDAAVQDYSGVTSVVDGLAQGRRRIAGTITNAKLIASVDASATQQRDPDPDITGTTIALLVGAGNAIESIGIYPIQDDADLPMLSTL